MKTSQGTFSFRSVATRLKGAVGRIDNFFNACGFNTLEEIE